MEAGDNGRAIAAMTLSSAGFILNDSLVKLASEDALPFGQILLIRSFFSIALMLVACQVTGVFRQFGTLRHPAVFVRAFAEMMATIFYLLAIFHIPIGNGTAILQALPLIVTAAAAIFFKAPVGWRRWLAIFVGFAGVLLIVKPGVEGFNAWSLSALVGIMFMALRDLATQRMPRELPTFGVALVSLAGVAILGSGLTVVNGWEPVSFKSYGLLAGAAALIVVGYVSLIVAMRVGEISVVAPFRYSAVLWGLAMGYLLWGDVPDAATVAGIVIIVVTGIYSFWREQRISRIASQEG